MKKLFLLLALMGVVVVGCSKDEVDKGNDNKTEQPNENDGGNDNYIPENIFFGLDKESVTISPDGGSVDVIVYSNYKWEISGTSDWCTPSVKGGDANEDGQKVTFSADVTYDDREATFWFRCADEKIKFVVSQKFKEAIIPDANNTFNFPTEGGVAVISYQTTVDCEVIIPEEAQDWITIAPATRGLVSESINLDIAENTTYSARTAVIKVVAKDNAELAIEYTINQEQNDAVLANGNTEFTIDGREQQITIKHKANIDCDVVIPDEAQDWVAIAPATRGLVAYNTTLNIAANYSNKQRSCVVKVVSRDYNELFAEYTITQNMMYYLCYTSSNGKVVEPYSSSAFGATIISNTYKDGVGVIEFNAPITKIGESAFSWCSSLTSITIPDSATTIGEGAFNRCSSLTKFNGKFASEDGRCLIIDGTLISFAPAGLAEYTIPNSVTSIGGSVFSGCSNLTSITIPDSVTTIEKGAFYNCSSLTSVTIPDSVTSIGESAFYGCTGELVVNCNIPSLSGAFNGSKFTSVTIGDGVTTIGGSAFADCSSLQEFKGKFASEDCRCLIIDGTLNAFAPAGLTEYTIPDSVTSIGVGAFAFCYDLTSVTIGDSVTSIGYMAFYYCDSLTSVTIPDSVTSIGSNAFAYCTGLTSVVIPDSVAQIGGYIFYECSNLSEIVIGSAVTTIGERAFYNCSSLTSVTIPDSVTSIGSSAFSGCTSELIINSKIIENNYTSKPSWLSGAEFTKLTIGDSVTSIGSSAFYGCSSLTSVTIPDSVTSIGSSAFYGCTSELIINSKIIENNYASDWLSGAEFTKLTIGDSVTAIAKYAFTYCRSLTSVIIGDSVTTIGVGAFAFCHDLTSVTIGDSVTSIGSMAFYYCDSLTSVYCKATTPPVGGSDMFYNNASGRKIYVPMESVEAYKSVEYWSEYADDIVGYNF